MNRVLYLLHVLKTFRTTGCYEFNSMDMINMKIINVNSYAIFHSNLLELRLEVCGSQIC